MGAFKDFLEAGEMGKQALGMTPSAINPAAGGQGRFPTMPTGKDGNVQATPLGADQMKKVVSGGPFGSNGKYALNKPKAVGLSGSTNSPKDKASPSPFGSNGATVADKPREAGISGRLSKPKAAGQQLNLGPGTKNPDTKSPLPKAK